MQGLPQSFEALFASGLAVNIALAVIGLEFFVLLFRRPAGTRRGGVLELILALGPGVCLMLALRAALTGGGALLVALWLTASLPLHLADIARRKL
jgi:hypothetical protein